MTKLLIITQKVDKDDDVLGFFYSWILEFAKHCEQITVICLEEGIHDFYSVKNAKPRTENSVEFSSTGVRVLSLGKEEGKSRLKYILRFYKYIFQERKNYDNVFVHMNQEYVLLGGLFWKFLGKRIFMWRNHPYGNFLTKTAVFLSNKVFCTSKYSYTARFKKTEIMPVGIDTERFSARGGPAFGWKNSRKKILSLGRISPVKNIDILIEAVKILNKNITLNIVGASTEKDKDYYDKLKKEAGSHINFLGSVRNDQTVDIYNKHDLFINLTSSGSFDKTILEAMACESLVLVANESLSEILPKQFLFNENNPADLAKKIEDIFDLTSEEKEKYGKQFRDYVIQNHKLSLLVKKFYNLIKT